MFGGKLAEWQLSEALDRQRSLAGAGGEGGFFGFLATLVTTFALVLGFVTPFVSDTVYRRRPTSYSR